MTIARPTGAFGHTFQMDAGGASRRCLIVSPHFPPSTLAGVHRARHLAKHLPTHGWDPVIIRVDPSRYVEPGDLALASLLPVNLSEVRTPAVPAQIARAFGFGDIGLRAYPFLASALGAAAQKASLVLITGSPFYPMLLAKFVTERLGLPVVLDFQDPWVSAQGATRARWSKGWLAHRLAVHLEPYAVRYADFITSVSDRQNEEMSARYPSLNAERMAAIPIGGDPSDFDALRDSGPTTLSHSLDPEMINISYVGTLLPRANEPLRAIFRALRKLTLAAPQVADKVRLHFVGTSNQPGAKGDGPVTRIAGQEGVADLVKETARRVPFLEALAINARSDGLLLIGSDEPHYTASKIYPSMMSGRPFLSLFHRMSSAHEILNKAGGGIAYAFSQNSELEDLVPAIASGLGRLAFESGSLGRVDPKAYAPYTADAVAGQFARVFDIVTAEVSS